MTDGGFPALSPAGAVQVPVMPPGLKASGSARSAEGQTVPDWAILIDALGLPPCVP